MSYIDDTLLVLNNRIASASGTTDLLGACTVQVKVPGTFNGFSGYTAPLCSGRYLQYAEVKVQSAEDGDMCKSITVEDTDGVIPVPYRASFPSYPILGTLFDDEAASGNQGWFLWPGQTTQLAAAGAPNFVPSGVYVIGKFQKKSATVGLTIWINYKWAKAGSIQ